MKTVFSNAMCAHVWAAQSQPHGHSDSMSFDGPTLYSYRTPIGYIPDGAKYGLVAFATSNTYSATTSSKHMPALRYAARGRRGWSVPQMGTSPLQLRDNLAYLQAQYTKEVAALMRVPCDSYRVSDGARSGDQEDAPTHAHETLRRMAENIADFMITFDVVGPALNPDESAAVIIARRDRLASDPKRAAKIAAAQAARLAAAQRAAAAAYERNKEWAEEWLAGVPSVGRHISCPQGGAMLRLSPDADKVQTSWGAEVPLDDARRALAWYDLRMSVKGAVPWSSETRRDVPLGHFTLDAINVDGSIKAGCHTIYAAQIEHLRSLIAPGHDGNGSQV